MAATHSAEHEQPWGLSRWLYSTNHKDIGTMYLIFATVGGVVASAFSVLMRMELQEPSLQYFANGHDYNVIVAAHGLIMIFFTIMPALIGGFGNWFVPLMIGAPDMAFPRLNMMSVWTLFVASCVLLSSFFVTGGPAAAGWTSYPPLSADPQWTGVNWGINLWILALAIEFVAQHCLPLAHDEVALRQVVVFVQSAV